ncbi:MAG: mannose-6-phosphate isomerase, partial [Bacteroidetes bacterium]|nr:mannose-6-phosphate isomerase [Bacteroidota bacterium]
YENYKSDNAFIVNHSSNIVKSPYFTTNIIAIDKPMHRDYYGVDSFVIYMCTEGAFTIEYENQKEYIKKGETVLIPAELIILDLIPDSKAKILEIFIEEV